MSLVSIIVPVYGVEQYLPECVESLLRQTHRELEIILVDDASPDNCPRLCDRYAAQDSRVRAVHKPNGGAASARNAGLDAATGDYICFVDGDDWVDPDYVNHLLDTVGDADIGICGFYRSTKSKNEPHAPEQPGKLSAEAYLLRFLSDWSCSLLWNKIYRRETIGDIRMAEGHAIDDEFFTYLVVMNSKNVAISPKPLYYYRLRGSSVMRTVDDRLERVMLDRVEYITTRYRNISEKMPRLAEPFLQDAVDTLIRYWRYSKNTPKAQKQIRAWTKAHRRQIMGLKLPLKTRLSYLYQILIKKPVGTTDPNWIPLSMEDAFD